jgi:dipeptidyl aminopeptidase/acylaminoacyl peptidase
MTDIPAHPDDAFLDRLLAVPALLAPSVSPDGTAVAWSWGGHGAAVEAYLRGIAAGDRPLRLRAGEDDVQVRSWRRDGTELLLALTRHGAERTRLMRASVRDPKPVLVSDPDPRFYISGGELHPNGRWLVYAANVDPATGQEQEASWIIRQDMTSGERRVLARPRRANRAQPMLSASGSHVLYSRRDRHPAGRQYWLVDIEGREDREILNFGDDVEVRASWAPSGQQVVVLADSGGHRRVGLWVLASALVYWLMDDPQDQIEAAFVPFGANAVVAILGHEGGKRVRLYDPQTRRRRDWPPIGPGTLLPLAPLAGGGWAGRYYHARQPEDLIRFDPAAKAQRTLPSLTGLAGRTGDLTAELIAPESIRWTAPDGLSIQGWLYRPRDRTPGRARGTVIDIHGGPTYHDENRFDPFVQYMLRRGFNLLQPNYRGSTGFGLAFQEAIRKQGWGGAEQEDIRSAIAHLIEAGIAEKGRVGVTGTSYGGYSAWWAITHFPTELVAAAAPICGMTDLVVDYDTTRPDLRPYSEKMMGGSPAEVPERYRERSPIHAVARIRGQLLIVQGLRDPNVTPANMEAVRRALEGAGIAHELLTFEDEGHGIRKRANRRLLYRRLADFFERAFAAAPAP